MSDHSISHPGQSEGSAVAAAKTTAAIHSSNLLLQHRVSLLHNCSKAINLEIDTDNLATAIAIMALRTLAELGKLQMRQLAQLKPRRNQQRVHLHAMHPLKLEEHMDPPLIIRAAAKHPPAIAQNRAG